MRVGIQVMLATSELHVVAGDFAHTQPGDSG
jgi:hypothetical protein